MIGVTSHHFTLHLFSFLKVLTFEVSALAYLIGASDVDLILTKSAKEVSRGIFSPSKLLHGCLAEHYIQVC